MSLFNKTYQLTLTRNYVSRWGVVEAVRELIQNALDSDSPFVFEFKQEGADTHSLRLTSEFTTLSPQTLLLGATSKADNKGKIGSFGEGYKIAMLVLTRLGHDLDIFNGNVTWRPRFQHSKQFNEELLVVDEEPAPEKNKGLSFIVHGLTEDNVSKIRATCLPMQFSVGEVKHTSHGDILMQQPGLLFVGGLLVCKTDLRFGYNIKPEYIQLERDRQTVSTWDLQSVTKEMWFDTKEWDRIAEMIESKYPDVEYAEYSTTELVKEACYQHFRAKNPGAVPAKNQEELKKLVAQGMQVVVVGSTYYSNITRSSSYLAEPRVIAKTPTQVLEDWFADARYHMHHKVTGTFRDIIKQSVTWKL